MSLPPTEFDLGAMSPRERYRLLSRLVAPRPIALVRTRSADGVGNLAPFSFFMLGGANPASCVIVPLFDRSGRAKDTLRNIEATGEYTINVVTEDILGPVIGAGRALPPEQDELEAVGFTAAPAAVVGPERVAEAPAGLECRLFRIVPHGDGPLASRYIIGEIVHAWVHSDLLVDGLPDNTRLQQIGRSGGDWYVRTTDRLARGRE